MEGRGEGSQPHRSGGADRQVHAALYAISNEEARWPHRREEDGKIYESPLGVSFAHSESLHTTSWCPITEVSRVVQREREQELRSTNPGAKNEGGQTCQLVSPGSPEICILCGVRLGRGAVRSVAAKLSRWRDPRANWTVRRSPLSSEPSVGRVRIGVWVCCGEGVVEVDCFDVITYGKLRESVSYSFLKRVGGIITRNYISSIHGILVLDESKAVHELDLLDRTGAMGGEMGLNVSLGGYSKISIVTISDSGSMRGSCC